MRLDPGLYLTDREILLVQEGDILRERIARLESLVGAQAAAESRLLSELEDAREVIAQYNTYHGPLKHGSPAMKRAWEAAVWEPE